MVMSRESFAKNYILCGEVDFFCLLCYEHMINEKFVEKHVKWEKHRKLMKTPTLVNKYKKEGIYKIEQFFYCQKCNTILIPTALDDHMTSSGHANPSAEDPGVLPMDAFEKRTSNVIRFNNIIITEKHWQGVIGQYCSLCNIEDVDENEYDEHIRSPSHIVRLISTRIYYQSTVHYYRKIREGWYHCFTCKEVVNGDMFERHFRKDIHCEKAHEWVQSMIRSALDSSNKMAQCSECDKMLNVRDKEEMLAHRRKYHLIKEDGDETPSEEEEYDKDQLFDHGNFRREVKQVGLKNYIYLNPVGAKGYCKLCDVSLSASHASFNMHIEGQRHQGHLIRKNLSEKVKKDGPKLTVKGIFQRKFMFSLHYLPAIQHVVINNDYVVDRDSFLMIKPVLGNPHFAMTRCFVCNIYFPHEEEEMHLKTDGHRKRYARCTRIITKVDSPLEYIREIRTNLFHCGTCNEVISYWDVTMRHIGYEKHKQTKIYRHKLLTDDSNLEDARVRTFDKDSMDPFELMMDLGAV